MSKPTELVRLAALMELTSGIPEVLVALIDGPVALDHPDLAGSDFREIGGKGSGSCTSNDNLACQRTVLLSPGCWRPNEVLWRQRFVRAAPF